MLLPQQILVPLQPRPLRIDQFLVQTLPQTSRSFWKRHLEDLVLLNGVKVKKGTLLKGSEILQFKIREIPLGEEIQPDFSLPLRVILENPHFLVVDKAAGVPVHPLSASEKGTLIQAALAQFPEIASVGHSKRELGLVHRLDVETSGLVLIARNEKAYAFLREEFQKRRVEKEYLALVLDEFGELQKRKNSEWQKIDLPIAHHPKNKKKMKIDPEEGRPAVTFFSVEERYGDFTLLRVKIPTGVRHQIRIHLAHLGHPIVGDTLYGGLKSEQKELSRFFLHATKLSFRHPETLKKIECFSPLAEELKVFLEKMKSKHV